MNYFCYRLFLLQIIFEHLGNQEPGETGFVFYSFFSSSSDIMEQAAVVAPPGAPVVAPAQGRIVDPDPLQSRLLLMTWPWMTITLPPWWK